ncbi:MAG: non-canonical purine NTP pyrophosphatase, partial [Chloroflexi bacterium]
MQRLLIATHNRGKVSEYAEILDGLPFELITLDELGIRDDVQETGATLQENARLKALTYSAQSGLLALADDSGLEVDALGGAPGVYSKRYAGKGKSDADRNVYLLEKLSAVP